jgi:hypothetical protein
VVERAGDDVVLDWTDDPAPGERFAVYKLTGPGYAEAVRIGTTTERSFTHVGAATSAESFAYRVSSLDVCGNESPLD